MAYKNIAEVEQLNKLNNNDTVLIINNQELKQVPVSSINLDNAPKLIEWSESSNLNDFVQTGIYHFYGIRIKNDDNLPIDNYGENTNIACTLIVDSVEGWWDESKQLNIPKGIFQTLFLGNRQGSETKMYTRSAELPMFSETGIEWEDWKEAVTSSYLGVLNSYDDLNTATEIGLYTGAILNLESNVSDVFKLEVINNYAVTTQISAATGSSVPNSVLQTITILNLDGNNATKKRIGTYNGSGYAWGRWEEAGATPKFKTGDVVCLTTKMTNTNNIKIIPWDTYMENPSNYEAIGLVVDPVKRTFLFAELGEYAFSTASGRDLLGEYSSFNDGMETRTRISGLSGNNLADTFPIFYNMKSHGTGSVFYPRCWDDTNNPQYFVPSLNEWKKAYNDLCLSFYDDENNNGSAMDRLIALKTGVTLSNTLFIGNNKHGVSKRFYSQISTMGINSMKGKNTFNAAGSVPGWTTENDATPIFGIYTEEEENV